MKIHRAVVILLPLIAAGPAKAQETAAATPDAGGGTVGRFAVGSGVPIGRVICFECDDPAAAGISGGFEFDLTEDVALVLEGVWTGGYTPSPSVSHDYFGYADVKIRYQLTEMRHSPYILVGVAAMWDRDTRTIHYGVVDGEAVHLPVPELRTETRTALGLATGFGWAFRVTDSWEIRPEVQAYFGSRDSGWSYGRMAVGIWYSF